MDKTICELFAGVGGFRLGFERLNSGWETVWFNQFEPNMKRQWAYECYVNHFGNCIDLNNEIHTNDDITIVDKNTIPDHTLLVGGFPCQDYSVARSLSGSQGIEGKKGVLWWQIRDVIEAKKPPFCLFENVDRLLKSPAKQRGRDFGIMLACLANLGYSVEWRVVDASHYGNVQRRKRIFIFASLNKLVYNINRSEEMSSFILAKDGLFARAFPISEINIEHMMSTTLDTDIYNVYENFEFPFQNAGRMINNKIYTANVIDKCDTIIPLKDILEHNVPDKFYISDNKISKWEYLKSAKKIERTSKTGHHYTFSEGAVPFPDSVDKSGRTMLTSEGTPNRSSHAICDLDTDRIRILTPIETERMNGFDDNWTDGMSNRMRYFCMGNALVVPIITRIGAVLDGIFKNEGSETQ